MSGLPDRNDRLFAPNVKPPIGIRSAPLDTIRKRFWDKVKKTDTRWIWTACKDRHGYGEFKINGITERVHRVVYQWYIGVIPIGLQIDHLCRVRHCVNPAHLEAVTAQENCARGVGQGAIAARTNYCVHGHEYTPENTLLRPNRSRRCKLCTRETNRLAARRYYHRHKLVRE